MEEHQKSGDYSILLPSSSNGDSDEYKRKPRRVKSAVRRSIKIVSWIVFIIWGAVMFFFPTNIAQDLVQDWISVTQDATIYSSTGSFLCAFSGPLLLIALLASLYINLSDEEVQHTVRPHRKSGPGYRIWTFPALVEGPFGVVSGAELIAILIFLTALIFAFIYYTIQSIVDYAQYQTSFHLKCSLILETWGGHVGMIGLFCLAFLFIPVSRGSVILRFIDIPFEHATRYHVWLGHLTIFTFTLHGFSYVLAWAIQGELLQNLFSWEEDDSIAYLPGVIALGLGLLMWATSLHLFRRNYFELFFYTHYLYIGFVIFFALHVGDFIFSVALGGILIFMLDRFLRFCQSSKVANILSITPYSCGVVELVISKPPNLKYNALSFFFVKARELSCLQWHPFSVSSTPLEGQNHVSLLVKALGDWTTQLYQSRIPLTVSIEGPYGHESPYYLTYTHLVLVAGGIGISPFIAILKDVLLRIKQGRSVFPNTIVLLWAIKSQDQLSLLPNFESICPSFFDVLDLEIQVFVTGQSEEMNSGHHHTGVHSTGQSQGKSYGSSITCSFYQNQARCGISSLVGTGDRKWSSIYVSSSILGFVVILGVVDEYLVNPYDLSNSWYIGLVLLGCVAAAVVVVGGLVIFSWNFWERKMSEEMNSGHDQSVSNLQQRSVEEKKTMNVQYGCRPNFEDIFNSMEEKWESIDVGVIVCGPPTLETSVAKEIRRRSLRRTTTRPIFHFHTHSFEL